MNNNASGPARSISDFAKTLKNNGIKGNLQDTVDNAMFGGNNTGSLVLDFLTRKKAGSSTKYKNFQRKLADMDMKAGGKAYDFFDKRKLKLANSFVQNQDILKRKGVNGYADEILRVKTTGLLNPIAKTKKVLFPIVGSMTVANHLLPDKKRDGDT